MKSREISHGNAENTEVSCFEIVLSYYLTLCGNPRNLRETKKGCPKNLGHPHLTNQSIVLIARILC